MKLNAIIVPLCDWNNNCLVVFAYSRSLVKLIYLQLARSTQAQYTIRKTYWMKNDLIQKLALGIDEYIQRNLG